MGINLQKLIDEQLDAGQGAAVKVALDADAIEDEKVLRAKDAAIAELQKQVDELRKVQESTSYDLKKQLDVKTAENHILRQSIDALQKRIAQLEGGNPAPERELQPDRSAPPSVAAFRALRTDADRAAYLAAAQAWFAGHTGVPKETDLSVYAGPMTITEAGAVIEGKIITGTLTVAANNVTVRKCRVNYTGMFGIYGYGFSGLTVEDCEITGPGMAGESVAGIMAGDDITVRRCDISGAEHGMHLQKTALIELNYIHHQRRSGYDPHYDCIIAQGWNSAVIIQDNMLVTHNTSAVLVKTDFGPIMGVTIRRNWIKNDTDLDPGLWAWYQIYSIQGNYGGVPTGVEISDNVVQKGKNGQYYWSLQGSVKLSGNIDYDTGNAI